MTAQPEAVEEMSAGFCNWVYRVDMPAPTGSVVVKLFSPLAKMRLTPPLRGFGDEVAGDHGLGPGLRFRNAEGLICDFVLGDTLGEGDIHGASAEVPRRIATRLAALHSIRLADAQPPQQPASHEAPHPIVWDFLESMLERIEAAADERPPLVDVVQVRQEVERMRRRFTELQLPVVMGHGDLKPSNVMFDSAVGDSSESGGVCFIDFELAGAHFRGYDLFKLFRTAGEMSRPNMQVFLAEYLAALPSTPASPQSKQLLLDELDAETLAAEPLTWLEAAVFFLFAIAEYPSEHARWAPLATQRWSAYLESAAIVDEGGTATGALQDARAARAAFEAREAAADRAAEAA